MVRLLIADASEALRLGLRMIFSIDPEEICIVAEESSALTVLQSAQRHRPDVMIVDGDMPGMDETLPVMLDWCRGCALIVLTMQTDPDFKLRMLRLGALYCLEKRTSPQELLNSVRVVMQANSANTAIPLAA